MTNETTSRKVPMISIIVPTHNVEELVKRCLDALVGQTYRDIEILCIDDYSEDKTCEVIKEYAEKDKRIRLLNNSGRGVSAARNLGIENARGKYIMMCDGDDYYEPTMCEKMLTAIEGSGADLAICEINMIYQASKEQRFYDEDYCTLRYEGVRKVDETLLQQINVYPVNKIYRKELIDKYNLRFPLGRRYEDAAFSYSYLCVSKSVCCVRERLYNYIRRHGSATTKTLDKNDEWDVAIDHLYVIIALYEFLKEYQLFEKWAVFYWKMFYAYERLAIKLSKSKKAKKAAQKLAAEFIRGHRQDFRLADIDAKGAISNITPGISENKAVKLKKVALRFLPTYATQIENVRRLEALNKRNAELMRRVEEILDRSREE